ncbi:hypothetical protein [Sphingomonas sp. LHG3406-1]|uniref:hypothetical protein n=1 Tax=Sphingomonas sp. LHG3406-1 TaxID=2804617 RepID=UPI00260E0D89|nr:hypothetical protein [Sphingomonas sp. LHG3406-1]
MRRVREAGNVMLGVALLLPGEGLPTAKAQSPVPTPDLATIGLLAFALVAGLAAAYGRELNARRVPGRAWWAARLLLLPLLAIAVATASEAFLLAKSTTAFTAAMLSLGGYDCLRLVEAQWKKRHFGETGSRRRGSAGGGKVRLDHRKVP